MTYFYLSLLYTHIICSHACCVYSTQFSAMLIEMPIKCWLNNACMSKKNKILKQMSINLHKSHSLYCCTLLSLGYLITMCLVQPRDVDQNKSILIFVITDNHTEAIYFTEYIEVSYRLSLVIFHISRWNAEYDTKKVLFHLTSNFTL